MLVILILPASKKFSSSGFFWENPLRIRRAKKIQLNPDYFIVNIVNPSLGAEKSCVISRKVQKLNLSSQSLVSI